MLQNAHHRVAVSFNVDYKALGAKLKEKRLHLGLTQEKISEKLDIDESYYSRIERGDRVLSVDTLVKLSSFYDLSMDWLLLDSVYDNDKKLLVEIDAIFRDKSPAQTALLLNLLKVLSEGIGKFTP